MSKIDRVIRRNKLRREESKNYKAVFTCGFCGKKKKISDKITEDVLSGDKTLDSIPCKCGNFSYCSSIRCKMLVNTKDWRMAVGR